MYVTQAGIVIALEAGCYVTGSRDFFLAHRDEDPSQFTDWDEILWGRKYIVIRYVWYNRSVSYWRKPPGISEPSRIRLSVNACHRLVHCADLLFLPPSSFAIED
jgi:hypothetical protein